MRVNEFLELLARMPSTALVKAWNADSEEFEEVTGLLWDDDGTAVYVQTDEA